MTSARVELRIMHPGTAREFTRAVLYCPSGHETVSAPVGNATGARLVAGDFSREWCSYGACGWSGDAS